MAAGIETKRSRFVNVVCLRSWWLVKAEAGFDGKELAVVGLSNREKEARRVFTSAPILKRYDDFNLVTADGIHVNLCGFIEKARTEANGFSSEVCDHFLFGFPPYWEECVKNCLSKESTAELPRNFDTGTEASSPQAGEHESADKDIIQGSLDSSIADKHQYPSVETVPRNQSSASILQKHDTKQGEATFNLNRHKIMKNPPKASRNSESFKKDLPSAFKSKIIAAANLILSEREAVKKLEHVKESTPAHDTVAIVSPEAAKTLGKEAASPHAGEHETVEEGIAPGCMDSYNAGKDPYLSVETVWRNHSSASNVEKQDAKPEKCTDKPNRKRMKKSAQASRNSSSVKNILASTPKSKRGVTADENLPRREPEKKSAHVNESTSVQDRVHIVSPESASFRRSRSGRLLLPSLEHWRNQRVLYDTDRKIIGVLGFES